MIQKNIEKLERYAEKCRTARAEYADARKAYASAKARLHSAADAVRSAEDEFIGFAWSAAEMPSPLELYKNQGVIVEKAQ